MNIHNVFQNRHAILPVIHVESQSQALRNTEAAREAGADGVFLINHGVPAAKLLSIHQSVVRENHDFWIGINCLDLSPVEVFQRIGEGVKGVWVDNAGIDERQEKQLDAERIVEARKETGWTGLYFGGVAFKYQRPVDDLAAAARKAAKYMDVVTTSGPGTGHSADIDKISVMKKALGEYPLAIASGITPENVTDYLDVADCFLVATGISKSFEELDAERVKLLVQTVRQASLGKQ